MPIDAQSVFNVISLIAAALGLPGIIALLLQRKAANKKLEIDEGSLEVNQFTAIITGYKQLLDDEAAHRKNQDDRIKEVVTQVTIIEKREAATYRLAHEANDKLRRLRMLFVKYTKRAGVPMTAEEAAEFEMTKPRPLRPLRG